MAYTWFRFYTEAAHDPKVQCLSGDAFKAWVTLMCIMREKGSIAVSEVAFNLRLSDKKAAIVLKEMEGLFDRVSDTHIEPHNWNVRQFNSDSSTPRTRAFRERHKTVPGTYEGGSGNSSGNSDETDYRTDQNADGTPRARSDSDTDTDSDTDSIPPKSGGKQKTAERDAAAETAFEDAYGRYPRKAARGAAVRAWKKLGPAQWPVVLEGLELHLPSLCAKYSTDPTFTPHFSTWLNQSRWKDPVEPASWALAARNGNSGAPPQSFGEIKQQEMRDTFQRLMLKDLEKAKQ